MSFIALIPFIFDVAIALAYNETPEPEALLQPRNYNPHPYNEGRGRPRFLTKSPTNIYNPGPVQFPPNLNSIHGLAHPYAKLSNKGRQFVDSKYSEGNNYQFQPAYDALSQHANKVLNNELKPQSLSKIIHQGDVTDTSSSKKHYAFSYTVRDRSSGDDFSHTQQQKDGAVRGSYQVQLPDGRLQIVKYTADDNGYRADVSYNDQHGSTSHHHDTQNQVHDRNQNNQNNQNHHHEENYHQIHDYYQPNSNYHHHEPDYHQKNADNHRFHTSSNYQRHHHHQNQDHQPSNYYTTPDPNYDIPEPSLIETPPPQQSTQATQPHYHTTPQSNHALVSAQPIYDYYQNHHYQEQPFTSQNYDDNNQYHEQNHLPKPSPTQSPHQSIDFTPTPTPYAHFSAINVPHVSINSHNPLNKHAQSHIFVSTTSTPYTSSHSPPHKPGLIAKLVTPTTPSPAYEDITLIPVTKYNISPTPHHGNIDHGYGTLSSNLLAGEYVPSYDYAASENHQQHHHHQSRRHGTGIGSTATSQMLISSPSLY